MSGPVQRISPPDAAPAPVGGQSVAVPGKRLARAARTVMNAQKAFPAGRPAAESEDQIREKIRTDAQKIAKDYIYQAFYNRMKKTKIRGDDTSYLIQEKDIGILIDNVRNYAREVEELYSRIAILFDGYAAASPEMLAIQDSTTQRNIYILDARLKVLLELLSETSSIVVQFQAANQDSGICSQMRDLLSPLSGILLGLQKDFSRWDEKSQKLCCSISQCALAIGSIYSFFKLPVFNSCLCSPLGLLSAAGCATVYYSGNPCSSFWASVRAFLGGRVVTYKSQQRHPTPQRMSDSEKQDFGALDGQLEAENTIFNERNSSEFVPQTTREAASLLSETGLGTLEKALKEKLARAQKAISSTFEQAKIPEDMATGIEKFSDSSYILFHTLDRLRVELNRVEERRRALNLKLDTAEQSQSLINAFTDVHEGSRKFYEMEKITQGTLDAIEILQHQIAYKTISREEARASALMLAADLGGITLWWSNWLPLLTGQPLALPIASTGLAAVGIVRDRRAIRESISSIAGRVKETLTDLSRPLFGWAEAALPPSGAHEE